jgi:hypothetical protein
MNLKIGNRNNMLTPRQRAPDGVNKRISLNLSGDIAELVEYLAKSQSVTVNEAIRRAIVTEAYIYREREHGSTVLIKKPSEEVREVVFR